MTKLVVVGSSNTDMIIQVPHIPIPGETILGTEFLTAAGGKGANQAVAAARIGGDVSLVACVGAVAVSCSCSPSNSSSGRCSSSFRSNFELPLHM